MTVPIVHAMPGFISIIVPDCYCPDFYEFLNGTKKWKPVQEENFVEGKSGVSRNILMFLNFTNVSASTILSIYSGKATGLSRKKDYKREEKTKILKKLIFTLSRKDDKENHLKNKVFFLRGFVALCET